MQLSLIDVIFTCDGKEYLTPSHLLREIEDELYVAGGRINIADLVSILNVDYNHVDSKASDLARNSNGEINYVLGQLVSDNYKTSIAEEANIRLQDTGFITIGELTKQYDLPAEFIENVVKERMGTFIKGVPDPNDPQTIFTESYIAQYKAKISGVLSGKFQMSYPK